MSFDIIFCHPFAHIQSPMQTKLKFIFLKLLAYNLAHIHTKYYTKAKKMLHEKIWVLPHAQKCTSPKKP